MTNTENELNTDDENVGSEERLPYETPELIDCGDVAKLTQSALNTTGADGGYS